MLKLTYCLVRKPGMSREDFQRHWLQTHGPLVAAAKDALFIRRYVQMHSGDVPPPGGDRPGLPADDYDGVAQLCWDSLEDVAKSGESEEGRRHAAILAEDEAKFIDFTRSRLFWGEEHVIFDR